LYLDLALYPSRRYLGKGEEIVILAGYKVYGTVMS
jgi:hypothetical protein